MISKKFHDVATVGILREYIEVDLKFGGCRVLQKCVALEFLIMSLVEAFFLLSIFKADCSLLLGIFKCQ